MIQIRHVPEDVHQRLKELAAGQGMSLSDYLLQEVTLLSGQMTWEELFAEIDQDDPQPTGIDWAEAVREGRQERERELEARTRPRLPPE
jgi:hypothetical protein